MTYLLSPGQIFAERYRVVRFLAEGGMGAVFVAEHLETERKVALKVLWPQILSSTKAVEQFRLEARIAARVQSEHIVQILDSGQDAATRMPFLAMELLQGQSLQDFVTKNGAVPALLAIQLLRQVALGLDKAHGYVTPDGIPQAIVHRDLKPENLFLSYRENGEPHVKILDFGLAKVMSETAALSVETKGTPLYMAFEQAAGRTITPQTDIWALGLVAFFLFTGRVYWTTAHSPEAGIQALFSEILTLPLTPASRRLLEIGGGNRLPRGFDDWLQKCIQRDAALRFSSAGQAIERLAALVDAPGDTLPLYAVLAATDVGSRAEAQRSQVAPGAAPSPLVQGPTQRSAESPIAASSAGMASTVVPMVRTSKASLAVGIAVVLGVALAVTLALRGTSAPAPETPRDLGAHSEPERPARAPEPTSAPVALAPATPSPAPPPAVTVAPAPPPNVASQKSKRVLAPEAADPSPAPNEDDDVPTPTTNKAPTPLPARNPYAGR